MALAISAHSRSSRKVYDVFLSYYGLGTRNNFVDDILYALGTKGIATHMGDISIVGSRFIVLQQGIFELLEKSSMAVIVFCKDFATTPKCLDELVKIMELSKAAEGGLNVLPVFYGVEPFQLRNIDRHIGEIHDQHIRDMSDFNGRFVEIYGEYTEEKAKLWRQALVELTNLHGLKRKLNNIPYWDALDFV